LLFCLKEKKIMNLNKVLLGLVAMVGIGQIASATVYDATYPGYTGGGVGVNNAAGVISLVKAQYDNVNQTLYYEARFSGVPGAPHLKTDAFTLAISPGPNPKGHSSELALLYFDATGSSPALTAYAYNGRNDFTSWNDGNGDGHPGDAQKIQSSKTDSSWIHSLTNSTASNGDTILGFKISTAAINAYLPAFPPTNEWTGVAFGPKFGVWFHPRAGASTSYGQDGFLTSWNAQKSGWFDGADINTSVVPEPVSIAVLAAGLGLMAVRGRRK
jgi:hypothetical protein